jgi:hypothetical protein
MTILRIDSSINGQNSASRHLTDSIVGQLKASNWGEQVVTRDLVAQPLPHLTLEAFADSTVVDEFLAADVVVIGAPMYNFTVPSQLKAWKGWSRTSASSSLWPAAIFTAKALRPRRSSTSRPICAGYSISLASNRNSSPRTASESAPNIVKPR